ncbi:globin [Thaumasiovibrio sp. DFM-14]|uniref:globin n=1 Tax=Thaumasiovibrio sp. DFM-14 TaxID=3384792 RepID=UPI00399FF859
MNIQETFNDSYDRCLQHKDFFSVFLHTFQQQEGDIAQKFAHLDAKRLQGMLKGAIYMIMLSINSVDARTKLHQYGKKHGPNGVNVTPEDYDTWLDCLLFSVKVCDPLYDEQIEQAWRTCFQFGIDIMKEESHPQAS